VAYRWEDSNISVLGRDGRQIERPAGSIGASPFFEIDLPYLDGSGTLEIAIQQDLSLKGTLKSMLETGDWSRRA
jgi:hypothetical protein